MMSKMAWMLSSVGVSLAIIATPALAANGDEDLQTVAASLSAGEFVTAEAQIAKLNRTYGADGAMLINLGNAYAGMGRRGDAQIAYQAAIDADPNMELDLADGSVRTVREVATDGLRYLGVSYAER